MTDYNTIPGMLRAAVDHHPDKNILNYKKNNKWISLSAKTVYSYARNISSALRHLNIKENDKVIGDTTRVLKQEKDYSRPDKGERIKVRIALTVEKISLDDVLDRLRVGGTIFESSNESIPHGSHH